jgi:hypothetical protein
VHDLATVDLLRERLPVTYQQAMDALDQAEGDVVGALAILENTTSGGLSSFEQKIREGVSRSLAGDLLQTIRWKILGQEVAQAPVALAGMAAVVVGLACVLISCSTLETEYQSGPGEVSDPQPPESP